MASYDAATLKVTELFSKAILLPMFVYGDRMDVCWDFIHLSATGEAEIAESSHLKSGIHILHIFIVYVKKIAYIKSTNKNIAACR